MSKFKYKKSILITVAVAILMALAVAGCVLNIINIVKSVGETLQIIGYIVALAICLFTLACAIGVFFFSFYTVSEDAVTIRYGIFYEKIVFSSITAVTVFKRTDALVMYYGNNKYQVILTDTENYDNFVKSLLEINPDIAYDVKHID